MNIDIKLLVDGEPGWTSSESHGWWAKGHHTAEAFCAAAAEFSIDRHVPAPHDVEYQSWRCVPWGEPGAGGYYQQAKAGTRGAFDVTLIDLQEIALREA